MSNPSNLTCAICVNDQLLYSPYNKSPTGFSEEKSSTTTMYHICSYLVPALATKEKRYRILTRVMPEAFDIIDNNTYWIVALLYAHHISCYTEKHRRNLYYIDITYPAFQLFTNPPFSRIMFFVRKWKSLDDYFQGNHRKALLFIVDYQIPNRSWSTFCTYAQYFSRYTRIDQNETTLNISRGYLLTKLRTSLYHHRWILMLFILPRGMMVIRVISSPSLFLLSC